MDKPYVIKGDSVRLPNGLIGVVTHTFHDSIHGWWAKVGRTAIYRHEELELVRRIDAKP